MKHKPKFKKDQVVRCRFLPEPFHYQKIYRVWTGKHSDLDGHALYQLYVDPALEAWGTVMFREKELEPLHV